MSTRALSILVFALLVCSSAYAAAAALPASMPDAAGRLPAAAPPVSGPAFAPTGGDRSFPELPGWPRTMGVDINYRPAEGPATVDIDGDGDLEVFAASTDQKLYGWAVDGTDLPGFPKTLVGKMLTSPTLGDIDGDGAPEIVVVTASGYAYALETNGAVMPGWPKTGLGNPAISSAVMEDLDGDGVLEIIVCSGNTLYVWNGDGSNAPGFPAAFQSRYGTCSTPAVGDIDGDGQQEIVVEGWEYMTVFHRDGTIAQGWPYHLPQTYDGFSYSAPVLVDLDGDGRREIVAGYHESGGGTWAGLACVWRYNGTVVPGWPYRMNDYGWCYSTAGIGDVDEDGQLEIAMTSHDGNLYLLNADGTPVPPFPIYAGTDNGEASCAIADIDDDNHLEILYGDNYSPGSYYSFERDGTITPGFPLSTSGGMGVSGSCVMDVDRNGRANICAQDISGAVHLWDLSAALHPERVPAGRPHYDDQHTGLFGRRPPADAPQTVEPSAIDRIGVWPNPASDRIEILATIARGEATELLVLDVTGRIVARAPAVASAPRWSISGLAAGSYYCRIQTQKGAISRPFIVIR